MFPTKGLVKYCFLATDESPWLKAVSSKKNKTLTVRVVFFTRQVNTNYTHCKAQNNPKIDHDIQDCDDLPDCGAAGCLMNLALGTL
jgi:hypothetical protein